MQARSTVQVKSNRVARPACQALKVPTVSHIAQMKLSVSVTPAMATSKVLGVTPAPAEKAACWAAVITTPHRR